MSRRPTGDASWFPSFCAADAATEPTTQLVPRCGPEHLGPDLDAAPHGNSVTGLKRGRPGATLFRDGQVKHVNSLYEPPQAPFFLVDERAACQSALMEPHLAATVKASLWLDVKELKG